MPINKCKRCHRVLKNPESVTHGYGPTCWLKVQQLIKIEQEERKYERNENIYQNGQQ